MSRNAVGFPRQSALNSCDVKYVALSVLMCLRYPRVAKTLSSHFKMFVDVTVGTIFASGHLE